MRSKAWLAASVWLRLARLPPPASRVRRSRRLRDTLAAAPGLLAHASVTETVTSSPMGPKLRYTAVHKERAGPRTSATGSLLEVVPPHLDQPFLQLQAAFATETPTLITDTVFVRQ